MRLSMANRLAAASVALIAASTAYAESGDIIVMRKQLTSLAAEEKIGPQYRWETSDWYIDRQACGSTTQTRLIGCVDSTGHAAPDEMCRTVRPQLTRTVEDYSTCGYSWSATPGQWDSTCSTTASRPVTVSCMRQDGQKAADEMCDASRRPAERETGQVTGGCSYRWSASEWKPWKDTCATRTERERIVSCMRSDEGAADPALCSGPAPAATETGSNYEGCGYSWTPGPWSEPSSTCSATAESTRTIGCTRSDGEAVDASFCSAATAPPTKQTQESYSGCTYGWTPGTYGEWSSRCSASATRTREVRCTRSDGSAASSEQCSGAKPATQETSAVYEGCTYAWSAGEWSTPSTCAAGVSKTRTVTCMRSDGTPSDPSTCGQQTRPADVEALPDYAGCTYAWSPSYGPWSSTCSDNATRSLISTCVRQDGATVADTLCTATRPSGTQTAAVYTGCSYAWSAGNWSDWSGHCTPASTRTRSVTCLRGGTSTVDASLCDAAAKPADSESHADYSQCGYVWSTGEWQTPSSMCSATATQTRTVTCTNSGTHETAADTLCTDAKPSATKTTPTYAGCTFSWKTGEWGSWSSTCSNTATRNRTVECVRSDGTTVSYGDCPGTMPAQKDGPTKIVTDCGGVLTNPGFEAGSLQGWTVGRTGTVGYPTISTSPVHGGSYSMAFANASNTSWAEQSFQTQPGVTYTLSGWGYGFGSYNASMAIYNAGGTSMLSLVWTNGSGNGIWTQKSGSFVGDGGVYLIRFWGRSGTTAVRIDDIVLSASGAP